MAWLVVAKPATVSVPKKAVVKTVVEKPATSELSQSDFLGGVALGLSPYIILPAILLAGVKGTIKQPKPPVVQRNGEAVPADSLKIYAEALGDQRQPPKASRYNKPLSEGVKEGLAELKSGKSTEELELTRKGIKLSVTGFGVAAAAFVLSLVASGPKEAPAPKTTTAAPVVKVCF